MNFSGIIEQKFIRPALGAALTALGGLALWAMPLGEAWARASYDYLFRFGGRAVTNKVVVVLMDNNAYDRFQQVRDPDQPWSRALHAQLLNRLAEDGCPLVVLDTFFGRARNSGEDEQLAVAMRRLSNVVLMAKQAEVALSGLAGVLPVLPAEPFRSAAGTNNWGVAWLDTKRDPDGIVRQHWPFPSPGPHASLPETAARRAGATWDETPQERWLRYYGADGGWTGLSYAFALTKVTNYFHDKIVFIGNKPATSLPDSEGDEFQTPFTRWTGESSGGVEILAVQFLNLVNGEWLRRLPARIELLGLIAVGGLLGGSLCSVGPWSACGLAGGAALAVTLAAATCSHLSNFWFPWLVIAGGQVPVALGWALLSRWRRASLTSIYDVEKKPFGQGAYGEVFLARHAKNGQWFAFKKIYRAKFDHSGPYEREFRGITRYLPVSSQHPGLLHVHYVGRDEMEGYFFYVMDLGDAQSAGWEGNPTAYKPCDLVNVSEQAPGQRLPIRECARIGLALADALGFLHGHGLIHRDIKPSNIIFVKEQPKLADVGLVTETRPLGQDASPVGSDHYMPPWPEPPGTPLADIYALGKVLYVISTGFHPRRFPEISTALVEDPGFMRLNEVICKACSGPDTRYASAAEMHAALLELQRRLEEQEQGQPPTKRG